MAHKKAGGSVRNGRDSNAQRLKLTLVRLYQLVASSFVSAVHTSTQVQTLV